MIEKIHNDIVKETCLKYVHPSGVEVYMLPMAGYSSAVAQFTAKFGSEDNAFSVNGSEIQKVPDGTAHYLEHKLFESEENDAFELFSQTGAYCNAGTSFDYTQYYFSCANDFGRNLEILLDFVQSPYFTPENVEKERGIIGQEITMYRDSPSWRVFTNLLEGMYSVNPVRNDIAGTVESIADITDRTLYNCYDAYYNPANMYLCVAGNFDPEEVLRICEEKLRNRAPLRIEGVDFTEPEAVSAKRVELSMPVAKPLFEIGFKRRALGGQAQLEEFVGFDILFETAFGRTSEFFEKMRGSGLINEQFSNGILNGRGFMFPFLRGESSDPDAVLEQVQNALRTFKKEPPGKEDFERIKRSNYGSMVRSLTDVDSVAGMLTTEALRGGSPFALIDASAAVQYERIPALLDGLDENNVCISIIKGENE